MANACFDSGGRSAFRGWTALGLGDGYSGRFAETVPVPVLAVQGDADLPSMLETAAARKRVAESTAGGRQLTIIAGADHFYTGRHAELIAAIAAFAAGPM